MNLKPFIVGAMLLLSSCGGGSDGPSSEIDGTWKGDLIQGVITCSDGTGIGAGGGLAIREVTLDVSGSDEIGSQVQAIDGNCLFEGTRTDEGFNAIVVSGSGCEEALDSIRFTLLEENRAALKYFYDINRVPANAGEVRCVISPDAEMRR